MNQLRIRFVKAFMDAIILAQLGYKHSLSGYDVIAFVHKKYGVLMSPGTVYATLYRLEREGCLRSSVGWRRRIYTLTEQGKKRIKAIQNHKVEVEMLLKDIFTSRES